MTLNPLKENLGLDKDKSFFKGILEKLGFDEKTGNVKDRLKDFFQPVKDSLKNAFTGVKESVKSVLTEVTEPIRNVAKSIDDKLEESNVFNKFKNKKESEADLGESDSEGSTKPTSKPKPVSAVRKMAEAYEDNVYNNATSPLDRLNIRKSQIANINKDMYDKERINDRNKSIEKQIGPELQMLKGMDPDTIEALLTANPLGFVSSLAMDSILPKIVGNSVQHAEKAFTNAIPTVLSKINDFADEMGTGLVNKLKRKFGQIFGYSIETKSTLSASIERGPILLLK